MDSMSAQDDRPSEPALIIPQSPAGDSPEPHPPDQPVLLPLEPIAPQERIVLLDVLRGVALLGIFMVNMPLFAFTLFQGFGGPELAYAGARNQVGWWIVALFFQFKFISMFSMLFGAGFIMQVTRAGARGRSVTLTYLRRLGALFCIGLVHAFLIWYGDILVAYSITGLLLLPFAKSSGRTLVIVGVAVLVISAAVGGGLGALQWAMLSSAPPSFAELDVAPRGFSGMLAMQFNPMHPEWVEAETAAFRDGPFLDALAFRIALWAFAILAGAFGWLWHVVGMFLIGAGLMRLGFFKPEAARVRARCVLLLVPGLAGEFLATWLAARDGWAGSTLSAAVGGAHGPTAAMVTLGYVGLISMAVDAATRSGTARVVNAVIRFVANTGRMALTCYLGESLLAGAIMYWWGLGWFGSVDRLTLIALVAAIWFALAIFANIWFQFFTMGPMERVWRWVTYGAGLRT